MITTVTLSPMLDKTVRMGVLKRGNIHRATSMAMVPGGKGINVSRQLKCLGDETLATGFLGGATGKMIRELMDREGIRHDFVETEILTREGVTYVEADGRVTAVFEPALKPPVECVHRLSQKVDALSRKSGWIVCSGSSPGGEADDVFYEAILSARRAGCQSVLDSYGAALTLAIKGLPAIMKLNKAEFEQSFRLELRNERDVRRELGRLIEAGVHSCILSNGARAAYAASKDGEWKVIPAGIQAVNPVGSGDAMVAGMLHGFTQAWDFERCLRFGVAAGAANARVWQVAGSSYGQIMSEEPNASVQKLP